MPTTTPQRRTQTAYSNGYGYYGQARNAEAQRAYSAPTTYPQRPVVRPTVPKQVQPAEEKKTASVKSGPKFKTFLMIAVGIFLCMTMVYRYSAVLERSARVDELKAQLSDVMATNQALSAKIDRQLEVGALEEYATGQLGMIRPDNSQVFYIDMKMQDAANAGNMEEDKTSALQGTPGALVRAIRVLK